MGFNTKCCKCKLHMDNEPGGIILSPPKESEFYPKPDCAIGVDNVTMFYICKSCWDEFLRWCRG